MLKKFKANLVLCLVVCFGLVTNIAFAGSDLDRALSQDAKPVNTQNNTPFDYGYGKTKNINTEEQKKKTEEEHKKYFDYFTTIPCINNHKDFENIIKELKTNYGTNSWIYHWAKCRYYIFKRTYYNDMPKELRDINEKDIDIELNELKENINNRLINKENVYIDEIFYTYTDSSHYYYNIKKYKLSLKDLLIIKNTKDVYNFYKKYIPIDDEIEDIIKNKFYEIPYNERKIIMPINKQYITFFDDFLMIDIDNLPKNMNFPKGHPIEGELYVGHPFSPNNYLPLQDHELVFTEDKIREFCDFVEELGATEVYAETMSYIDESGRRETENIYGGKFELKGYGIEGEYEKSNDMKFENELRKIVKIHEMFSPNQYPKLAENLYWYNQEPSWQRLYKKRMRGAIIDRSETISTSKSSMVQEKEYININGELKILVASLGGKYSKLENREYHQNRDVEISLHVIFEPLKNLEQFKEKK